MSNVDAELAWMAGIIDGEGTINVYGFQNKERKEKNSTYSKCIVIHVGNSEKELVEPFHKRFGGRLKLINSKTLNKQHQIKTTKNQWKWTLTFDKGEKHEIKKLKKVKFLQAVLPYLHSPIKIKGVQDSLKFLGNVNNLDEFFGSL